MPSGITDVVTPDFNPGLKRPHLPFSAFRHDPSHETGQDLTGLCEHRTHPIHRADRPCHTALAEASLILTPD